MGRSASAAASSTRCRRATRRIAMVFQSYALYPHMTVHENMAFALKVAKAPRDGDRAPRRKAADILRLEPYLDRRTSQLSGGQRQRVAMGRAIIREPEVFLFDEPLSNLDAQLRSAMRIEIKRLHQRLGTTAIYVTHDQTEAMTLADKIVILRDGRHRAGRRPARGLRAARPTQFVAGFIGSPAMNMLRGPPRSGGWTHAARWPPATRSPPRRRGDGAGPLRHPRHQGGGHRAGGPWPHSRAMPIASRHPWC